MAGRRYGGGLRWIQWCVLAAVLTGTLTRPARAENPFLGVWQGGTLMDTVVGKVPIQIRLTFLAHGTYWQQTTDLSGAGTMQGGRYELLPNSMLQFSVEKWEPGGERPAGSLFHYRFLDRNALALKDANFGGTLTLKRTK